MSYDERVAELTAAGHTCRVRIGDRDEATKSRPVRVELDGRHLQAPITDEVFDRGAEGEIVDFWFDKLLSAAPVSPPAAATED